MNATTPFRYPTVLTIAGSDSGGGAGIQADLKTFSALGVYGLSAVTAVTAQNTREIRRFEAVDPGLLRDQLEVLFDDFTIDAVKIGMLPTVGAVQTVARLFARFPSLPVVLDPVLVSTSGSRLIDAVAIDEMRHELFPRITLLTPNVVEAGFLTGTPVHSEADRETAGIRLMEEGCKAVLIKGGHLEGDEKTDVLFRYGTVTEAGSEADCHRVPEVVSGVLPASSGKVKSFRFKSPAVVTCNTHGTGCTLSSAIAAYLALGAPLEEAVGKAKRYITQALQSGRDVQTGKGNGPLNHFFAPLPLQKISLSNK